ncbi:uncharacterized protein KZ484_007362 [Pholidichthys leucotaenia]
MAVKDTKPKSVLPSLKLTLVLMVIAFMPVLSRAMKVNCTEPTQPALLKALTPIFNMSSIRPVMNSSTCTEVYTYFTLYGILGVDEKAQLLITYIWLQYWWQNEFISWDREECGTDKITLPRTNFWVPDIVINEFMDENKAPKVPYMYIYNDGKVNDAQPVRIVSSCNLDIYTFPFDIQNCTLTFNSYIHYAWDIKIFLGRPAENITQISKNVMTTMGEWELIDITTHKNAALEDDIDNDGFYVDNLKFHIRVRRRATMYVVNLLIPSCFLITVDLFSFLLPPQSVDRSAFKMTLILGYTVFLLIMNDLLPVTGNTLPLINVFFSICLALMVASLLETILITNLLCGSADFAPVSRWIRIFVLQILGFLVCLPQKTAKPKDSEFDLKIKTVVSRCEADKAPAETMGPTVEDKALQELKSLGKDLHAIRLQVEQQLKGSQSSEEWIQCHPLKVKPSKVLFICISLLMSAPCNSVMLRCSQPSPPSLLEAFKPVFNMNSIRPVMNTSTVTHVKLHLTLFGILGVDEKTQVLTTFIWQVLEWDSEFTTWDPNECGTFFITVPRKQLWVPDVVINEFMEENTAPFVPYTYLFANGRVIDSQPVKVISSCKLDIYLFPFDIQNCSLSFNSYSLRRSAFQLHYVRTGQDTFERSKEAMKTMGEWELVGIHVIKLIQPSTVDDFYEELRFFVAVRRRAMFYVVNILLPSIFLISVDLFSFILPPKNVDRALFKMTLILGYTVFLLNINALLPITGNGIPLISVFLYLCLTLMVASLLETIIITNLLRGSSHYCRAPRWIRVLVLHIVGRLVCLPPKPKTQEDLVIQNPATQEMKVSSAEGEDSETSEQRGMLNEDRTMQELRTLGKDLRVIRTKVEKHLGKSKATKEWIQIGFIIDRLLFISYILFISCLPILGGNWMIWEESAVLGGPLAVASSTPTRLDIEVCWSAFTMLEPHCLVDEEEQKERQQAMLALEEFMLVYKPWLLPEYVSQLGWNQLAMDVPAQRHLPALAPTPLYFPAPVPDPPVAHTEPTILAFDPELVTSAAGDH